MRAGRDGVRQLGFVGDGGQVRASVAEYARGWL
jgi:hypothetical protein